MLGLEAKGQIVFSPKEAPSVFIAAIMEKRKENICTAGRPYQGTEEGLDRHKADSIGGFPSLWSHTITNAKVRGIFFFSIIFPVHERCPQKEMRIMGHGKRGL